MAQGWQQGRHRRGSCRKHGAAEHSTRLPHSANGCTTLQQELRDSFTPARSNPPVMRPHLVHHPLALDRALALEERAHHVNGHVSPVAA